jgi:hypothetical protein
MFKSQIELEIKVAKPLLSPKPGRVIIKFEHPTLGNN